MDIVRNKSVFVIKLDLNWSLVIDRLGCYVTDEDFQVDLFH